MYYNIRKYDIQNGGDVGSGSIYIDSVGNPIERDSGRRRKSDYEYRVSRIETPPMGLVSGIFVMVNTYIHRKFLFTKI